MGKSSVTIQNSGLVVSTSNRFPVDVGAATSSNTAGATSTVSFVRTADTNAYNAGDVIGINAAGSAGSAIHTFTSAGPAGGVVFVTGWDLTIDLTAVTSGMTTFTLHLYDASPTAIVDNAAYDLVTADQSKHLCQLDAIAVADLGSTVYGSAANLNQQLKLASGVTSLYGELVTNGGYTPASGTAYKIRIRTVAV